MSASFSLGLEGNAPVIAGLAAVNLGVIGYFGALTMTGYIPLFAHRGGGPEALLPEFVVFKLIEAGLQGGKGEHTLKQV